MSRVWLIAGMINMLGMLGMTTMPSMHEPDDAALRELLPGVRVGEGVVSFTGAVCADLSHPQTPVVYLELLVTGPDSREHEALVVTNTRASAIHAGLLAAGFEPGRPAAGVGTDRQGASGDPVIVEVAIESDEPVYERLDSWVVRLADDAVPGTGGADRLCDAAGWGLVFAGSRTDERGYAADQTGTIVGLTGFGTEVVGASWGLSPQASIDAPVWIADASRVPPVGSRVTVRLRRDEATTPGVSDDATGASVGDDPDPAGT